MTETQQRTLTGGTAGAAGGAIIGAIAGNAGLGAAIGAGAGLAGGYLYGKHEESTQAAYQQGIADGSRQSQPPSGGRCCQCGRSRAHLHCPAHHSGRVVGNVGAEGVRRSRSRPPPSAGSAGRKERDAYRVDDAKATHIRVGGSAGGEGWLQAEMRRPAGRLVLTLRATVAPGAVWDRPWAKGD